jgi:hypothetical protein
MRHALTPSTVRPGSSLALAGLGLALLGAATLRTASAPSPTAAPGAPVDLTVPPTAPTPEFREPPGGPLLWGISVTSTDIALDGRHYAIHHERGTGALVRFAGGCPDGDLEVARLAPAPRVITHRPAAAILTAYVPDGTYELTAVCGHARGATTRLELVPPPPTDR